MSKSKMTIMVPFALACLGSFGHAQSTFSDGVFDDADWFSTSETHGNGGTFSDFHDGSGGDPGDHRRVNNSVSGAPSSTDYSLIISYHWQNVAVYDPAASGSIEAIDYGESSIMFVGFGDGQATGPAVLQGGVAYIHRSLLSNQAGWTSQSIGALDADAFERWDDPTQHPDFSPTGAPITFGYFRSNSTCDGCPGYSIDAGIDNWSVTLHTCTPSWSNYGAGWPGTLGIPGITASNDPVIGQAITVSIDDSAPTATFGLLLVGFAQASIVTNKGGTLLVAPPFLGLGLSLPIGHLDLATTLPADPALCGLEVDAQCLELDSGASKGLSFTPGLSLILGD